MKALVDGDIVIFRSAFAAEKAQYTLNGHGKQILFDSKKEAINYTKETGLEEFELIKERIVEPLSHAIFNLKNTIDMIVQRTHDDTPTIFLSSPLNFRKILNPSYKANRDKTMRPHWEQECIQFIKDTYLTSQTEGIEADDGIGIAMDNNSVCVSIDKDLDQLIGKHYNWVKDILYVIDPFQAAYKFYYQMIVGDSVDNIKGIEGIGEIGAAKALALATTPETLEWSCKDLYKKVYEESWRSEWEKNKQLVSILQTKENLEWAKHILAMNGTQQKSN